MADLNDVANALVALAAQAVYPNGTGQTSVAGVPVRLGQGWPDSQQLDRDLAAGTCNVSVYPLPGERNVTRFDRGWKSIALNTPTLTATIAGQTITLAGTIPAANNPTNVVILSGNAAVAHVYAVQTTDTLASIATALAAMIAGATSAGPVITIPANVLIVAARVGITGTSARELRRQERQFQITVWADTPTHRTALASAVDVALAALSFIALPDGFAARVIYKGSPMNDGAQTELLYRRDLIYSVEYPTTEVVSSTQVTQIEVHAGAVNTAPTTYTI